MKRLLAALLTLSMLVGIVPFSAFAESPGAVPETFAAAQESPGLDDETVQSIVSDPLLQGQYAPPQQTQPTVDTSNMSMEATDSFGKLLVNSIDEQNSASSSENRVIGVTVDGSTATVEYVAAEDADIVVALYTDDSEELMSASGTVDVFAMEENTGHSTVTVPLTGSIPASFIVKAFLLDKDEHAPLCNEFTSLAYTKDLSDLESSTIYDYPENQVVNLDEDTKENSVDSPWFEHRLDIQKIIINSGVTSIGNFAFAFCSNVTSVSVPDSVTRIGQGCFAQCANLTSIALPDDVTSIPMGSFTGCSSLVSISYSSKLESIGLMAFEDCVSLRSIDLPYGLTSIGYAAFMDCHSLTSITLPESLSGLGGFMGEVFANCTSLTSVTFPRSFTSTGFGTFGGCTSLVDVTIPDTITTIGASTFSDCTSLTNITLPSSITAIGEDAFSGCTSLTSFVIPNGVPSIGEDTFRNCYALTAITIPASVTTIGYAAFEYCYNLSSVNYAGTPAQWKQIDIDSGNTALEQAYEGNPISSCGDNATWSIDNAGTLTIRGTGEITDTPWSDPMILPYSVHIKNVVLEDGITGICSYAFDYTDIVSVTLPATLTHIDYSAFDGCSDLTTVNYAGSPEQWNNIKIANHNDELLNATRHYYSSNASTVSSEENSIFPSTATGNDHSFAASFSDLTPGVSYAVIVSRSEIDLLAPENLIYINQFRATSSGYQQSFQTPRSSALNADDMTYVIASGIYSFDEAPTPTPTPGGGSSSGGGGGGGGGAAVLIGVGAAAAITAGVIMMSPVEIKGRVVLADQAAVPGAKISLLREGKVVAQTTADENGSFSLKAKRGSYELTAAYTTADGQLIYKIIDIKAPAKDLTVTF